MTTQYDKELDKIFVDKHPHSVYLKLEIKRLYKESERTTNPELFRIFNKDIAYLESELKGYEIGQKEKEKLMLQDELEFLEHYYKEHKTCIQCNQRLQSWLCRIYQIKERMQELQ